MSKPIEIAERIIALWANDLYFMDPLVEEPDDVILAREYLKIVKQLDAMVSSRVSFDVPDRSDQPQT